MRDSENMHLKIQDLCDCYATNDPLKEMSIVKNDRDLQEAALKWLALATLHGINANAKKISIQTTENGEVEVTAKYRKSHLPSPGSQVGQKIFETIQDITHITEKKGKTNFAVGIRDSSIDMKIKVDSGSGKNKVTLSFIA